MSEKRVKEFDFCFVIRTCKLSSQFLCCHCSKRESKSYMFSAIKAASVHVWHCTGIVAAKTNGQSVSLLPPCPTICHLLSLCFFFLQPVPTSGGLGSVVDFLHKGEMAEEKLLVTLKLTEISQSLLRLPLTRQWISILPIL